MVNRMRVVLRSSSLLFSLLGIAMNVPLHKVRPVLRRGSADGVRIGMTLGELASLFGKRMKIDERTSRADVFLAPEFQQRADLSFETENGTVSAIWVYSRRYKTEAGIGVGDEPSALAAHYRIRWTDDNLAEVDDLSMKFEIRDDRIAAVIIS
jgi:hypothetical protein